MIPNNKAWKQLSPLRNSSACQSPEALAAEQARHFGVDPDSPEGAALVALTLKLYQTNAAADELARLSMAALAGMDRRDRVAWFNAKRFVSFQLAKILDSWQAPSRLAYQSLTRGANVGGKGGVYPLFANVPALFSATPVITRTATYLYACTEWVEDAMQGNEPLLDIYSRLLNPTSLALSNAIVELECGANSDEYLVWNFNSGMAAIDAVFSQLLDRDDILLVGRNVYGGVYQLLHDWYALPTKLNVALEWVGGVQAADYRAALAQASGKYADRLAAGSRIYLYLESPCNPHGSLVDVAGICRVAHEHGCLVMVDSTVATPWLAPMLQHAESAARPDFVVHSYTKDLAGMGATTAGGVIARVQDMFIPKGESAVISTTSGERRVSWEDTMFWKVFYIKGGFLDADKAFEVLTGLPTLGVRMLEKAINTSALALALAEHPGFNVSCPLVAGAEQAELLASQHYLGLPAPLFTIDAEGSADYPAVPASAYKQFLDLLEPTIGLQVSLGQCNTIMLCPGLTSHSELSAEEQAECGISATTMRISVGLEDPRTLIAHMQQAAAIAIDPHLSDFSRRFPSAETIDSIYQQCYLDIHQRHLAAQPGYAELAT